MIKFLSLFDDQPCHVVVLSSLHLDWQCRVKTPCESISDGNAVYFLCVSELPVE